MNKSQITSTKSQINPKSQALNSKLRFGNCDFDNWNLFGIWNLEFGISPKGFTLLEMLISTGIFAVVIITAIGAMVSLNQAQVKASNIQNIQDNIRFTLEFMTKEIRTGSNFSAEECGPPACRRLRFIRQDGKEVVYCLDNGVIKRQIPPPGNCEAGSPITSSAVSVNKLFFSVIGQALGPSDGQPRITVTVEARSVNPTLRLETDFDLQTTVTARARDS